MPTIQRHLLFVLLCALPFSALASSPKEVTIETQHIPLVSLLEELSRQTSYYFSYPSDLIKKDKVVIVTHYQGTVEDFLPRFFKDSIVVETFKNQYIIRQIGADAVQETVVNPSLIILNGLVIDDRHKPIPYATISIKGTMLGTTTNSKGAFEFKIPRTYKDSVIQVSCLGYFDHKTQVNLFPTDGKIVMNIASISLQEVIIRGVGTQHIVAGAKLNLEEKYRNNAYGYQAFYREYSTKKKSNLSYSEALFEGYSPKRGYAKDRLLLTRARKLIKSSAYRDTVQLKLKGGTDAVLSLDIAHFKPDFLLSNSQEYYTYRLIDIQVWHDELVYIVAFSPTRISTEAIFSGELYISLDDLILKGATFEYTKEHLSDISDQLIIQKGRGTRVVPHRYKYRVEYQELGDRYHISYVQGEVTLKVKPRKQLRYSDLSTTFEMVVTNVDTLASKPKRQRKPFRSNSVFSEEIEFNQSPFWEFDNLIVPEKEIMDAFYQSGFILETAQ